MACLKCCQVNTIADGVVRDVEHGFFQGNVFRSLNVMGFTMHLSA
jgi:hypothetical protein